MLDHGITEAITVQNLVKKYGDITAVDDVSFSVREGEVFGILGPNGAGKTTILEIIEGLLRPTSGTTTVFGMDSHRSAMKVKEVIGVQLQASAYFGYLKLKEKKTQIQITSKFMMNSMHHLMVVTFFT